MGTVVGLADEAKLLDEDGKLPGMNRVLLVAPWRPQQRRGIGIVEHHVHRERRGDQ